jgi:diacylglycerol kinase family enzyme
MVAVILKPIGALSMLWLLFRGAIGTLGEASAVENFKFHRMVVKPRRAWGDRMVKVAFDGEVRRMRTPLEFRVSPKPLYLLKPMAKKGAADLGQDSS